jgi:hypothetical protein
VKSYIESLQSFVANGQYDPSGTQPLYSFPVPTSTTNGAKVTTTKSKAAAPKATGEVALGLSVVVGILALAIAL